MSEGGTLRVDSPTDAPEVQQLALEQNNNSEESQITQERSENGNGGPQTRRGVEKRINRATKEKYEALRLADDLRQRLAKYESVEEIPMTPTQHRRIQSGMDAHGRQVANGNGHAAQIEAESTQGLDAEYPAEHLDVNEAAAEERQPESEAPQQGYEIPAMREHYPDWDVTMTAAQGVNIPPSAAQVLHTELPKEVKGHVVYMLAKHPELREKLDSMDGQQAADEIRKMGSHVNAFESGGAPFMQKVKATFSPKELQETKQAIKGNELGSRVVLSLMKELNQLPNGPQVFKTLLTDAETCQRLSQMSQTGAMMEIARISGRLEVGNGKYVAPVSKAPAPIRPLGGGALRPTVDPTDPELPYQEYKKLRQREEEAARIERYGRR